MLILGKNIVELTDIERYWNTRFNRMLDNGASVLGAAARVQELEPNLDPAFYRWIRGEESLAVRVRGIGVRDVAYLFAFEAKEWTHWFVGSGSDEEERHSDALDVACAYWGLSDGDGPNVKILDRQELA